VLLLERRKILPKNYQVTFYFHILCVNQEILNFFSCLDHTLAVANASLHLLHRMVRQKLTMVQEVLSQECISLEFRHIASYLLWYCQAHNETDLLHLTIILVGYFAAKNVDNQVNLKSCETLSKI